MNAETDLNILKQKVITFTIAVAIPFLILACGVWILLPFFKPIAWAIILALFFFPFYERINRKFPRRENLNAFLMCILIMVFIITPTLFLMGSMANEVVKVYNSITTGFLNGDIFNAEKYNQPYIKKAFAKANELWLTQRETIVNAINDVIKNVGQIFVSQSTALVKNVARFIMDLILMLTMLFYFFRDGKKVHNYFYGLLPFHEDNKTNFMSITLDMLNATLYGNIMTGIVQAGLGILILYVLDFSAPIMWGMLMGFASFIPMVGTSLIWWPQVIYLFVSGAYIKGFVLMGFGMIVIGQIDYFLRPFFMATKTKIHNMLLILGIVGGLTVFGFLGLILGPLIIALCVAILEVFRINYVKNRIIIK
jgi:predicted PurR-regulated permease PerM